MIPVASPSQQSGWHVLDPLTFPDTFHRQPHVQWVAAVPNLFLGQLGKEGHPRAHAQWSRRLLVQVRACSCACTKGGAVLMRAGVHSCTRGKGGVLRGIHAQRGGGTQACVRKVAVRGECWGDVCRRSPVWLKPQTATSLQSRSWGPLCYSNPAGK